MECTRKKDEGNKRFEICTVYPCHDLVPLINPNDGVKPSGKVPPGVVNDVVVLHRDDVKLFRAELAEWGYSRLKVTKDIPPLTDAGKLLQEMLQIGDLQLERFKSKSFFMRKTVLTCKVCYSIVHCSQLYKGFAHSISNMLHTWVITI